MLIRVGLVLLVTFNVIYCSAQDAVFQPGWTDLDLAKACKDSPDKCRTLPKFCSGSDCHVILLWSDPDENDSIKFLMAGSRNFVQWITVQFLNREHNTMDSVLCEMPHDAGNEVHNLRILKQDLDEEFVSSQNWYESLRDGDTVLRDDRFYCRFSKVLTPESMPYIKLYYNNLNNELSNTKLIEIWPTATKSNHIEALPLLSHRSKRSLEDNYTAGCGETKGCFTQGECLFTYAMITGTDGIQYLRVQLESDPGRDWVAIGFSRDQFMAGTSVVECVKNTSGSVIVQHSYNPARRNEVIDSRGIKVIEAGVVNGIIKCSFDRKAVYSGDEADPRLYNITEEYRLILAKGAVDSLGVKIKHEVAPVPSPFTNLSAYEVSSSPVNTGMCAECTIKAHACLMITAWVFLASLGIFMPRYAKPYLIERKIFNSAAWFVMHRILMVLCWCATASGFIIIFVFKNGNYATFPPTDPSYYSAHPPIGITVMILVTLNPIMALLRCAPDHRRRPIFNWAHLGVGTSAQILAIINIFFGLEIHKFNSTVFWLMVAYISFHVLIEIILLITKYSPSETVASLEAEGAKPVKRGRMIPTFSLIGIYAVGVIGLWIAMMVLIATS